MTSTDHDTKEEARLQKTLQCAYAVPESSEALQARLARLVAAQHNKPQPRADRWSVWKNRPVRMRRMLGAGLAMASVAGAFAVAVVVGTVGPRVPEARAAWQRMEAAVARVNSAHWIEWRPTPNGPEQFRERWYQNGMWRQQDSQNKSFVSLQRDGMFYWYHRDKNKVIFARNQEGQAILSLTDLLQLQTAMGLGDRIRALPDTVLNDRPARRIQIDLPNSQPNVAPAFDAQSVPLRAIVYVDPETDLPFRTETQACREGAWQTVWLNDVRYNEPSSERLFAANFPGARFVEQKQAAQTQWRRGLEQGVIRRTVGGRTITLRSFDTTEVGHVFVWYTISGGNDDPSRDWEIEVSDEYGRRFERIGGGSVGRVLPELASRYTFGGARLQADWFRPTGRTPAEWPNHWTLTVRLPGGTTELTPNRIWMGGAPLPEKEPYREFLLSQTRQLSAAARNRAESYLDGRWKDDLPLVRAAQQDNFDIYKDALLWYRSAVDLENEAAQTTGERFDHANDWRKIADVLRKLGRNAEAEKAERQAASEAAAP